MPAARSVNSPRVSLDCIGASPGSGECCTAAAALASRPDSPGAAGAAPDRLRQVRIGVLASGSGTILQSLLDADLPIAVVIVDRPCAATERAEAAGVPAVVVERTSFGADFDRVAYTTRWSTSWPATRST